MVVDTHIVVILGNTAGNGNAMYFYESLEAAEIAEAKFRDVLPSNEIFVAEIVR